jgi:DNA-binding LytR/AlgR family response regulator
MKVVIIEDEIPAAERLKNMLLEISPDMEILHVLTSVRDSVKWFELNNMPDLIFMDIELTDGTSLDIINQVKISCPAIFTTAYDEYWQEAFEHNSIDYLLKPFKNERLQLALRKYNELKDHFTARYQNLVAFQQDQRKIKDRFLVKRGTEYASIKADDIAFFYATHKLVCLVEKTGSKFILDNSLSEIEKQLKPDVFFRINRKYLVHINSIRKINLLPKSKLLIEVFPVPPDEIIVSAENSSEFKNWMDR